MPPARSTTETEELTEEHSSPPRTRPIRLVVQPEVVEGEGHTAGSYRYVAPRPPK